MQVLTQTTCHTCTHCKLIGQISGTWELNCDRNEFPNQEHYPETCVGAIDPLNQISQEI